MINQIQKLEAALTRKNNKLYALEIQVYKDTDSIIELEAKIDELEQLVDKLKFMLSTDDGCDCSDGWESAGCDDIGRKLKRCLICNAIGVR